MLNSAGSRPALYPRGHTLPVSLPVVGGIVHSFATAISIHFAVFSKGMRGNDGVSKEAPARFHATLVQVPSNQLQFIRLLAVLAS